MSEPLTKSWTEDQLREAAMEFMRCDFDKPKDEESRNRYYERLGLLISYTAWLWDVPR
jgi:hypothetical protein